MNLDYLELDENTINVLKETEFFNENEFQYLFSEGDIWEKASSKISYKDRIKLERAYYNGDFEPCCKECENYECDSNGNKCCNCNDVRKHVVHFNAIFNNDSMYKPINRKHITTTKVRIDRVTRRLTIIAVDEDNNECFRTIIHPSYRLIRKFFMLCEYIDWSQCPHLMLDCPSFDATIYYSDSSKIQVHDFTHGNNYIVELRHLIHEMIEQSEIGDIKHFI